MYLLYSAADFKKLIINNLAAEERGAHVKPAAAGLKMSEKIWYIGIENSFLGVFERNLLP